MHSSRLCSMLFVSSWSHPLFRRVSRLAFAPAMTKRPDLTLFVPVLTFQFVISKPHAPLRQTSCPLASHRFALRQNCLAVPVLPPLTQKFLELPSEACLPALWRLRGLLRGPLLSLF